MKILIITNHSYMFYRFRKELSQALMQENEVILSTPFVGHEEDLQAMGLRCINTELDRRGTHLEKEWKLFREYRLLLKAERPDMVITYSIKPNIYAGIACTLARIPYCVNVQGLGTAFQSKKMAAIASVLYKVAIRKARTVFFENQGNVREFVDRKIIPLEKVNLLPGAGINLDTYRYQPYPENERFHFLYLGRIMREKGIDELFAAMCRLHAEQGDRVVLDLVGFFDDDYEAEVKALVDDGIAVFHGFQSEPRPYYAGTDCVVMPSYHEGMSNVLLEAAATGRPVITSNIHGCKEAVQENVSGLLCGVRDENSLYEAMVRVMAMTREEREAMGIAGRAHMEAVFDKKRVVEQTVRALGLDQ